MNHRSRRASKGPSVGVRLAVWERDESACTRCSRSISPLSGGYSIHHRQPRGMGGSSDPALNQPPNLMLLCGTGTTGCHGWVESHRDQARELGYLVRRGEDPATVPVVALSGVTYLLDDDRRVVMTGAVGE